MSPAVWKDYFYLAYFPFYLHHHQLLTFYIEFDHEIFVTTTMATQAERDADLAAQTAKTTGNTSASDAADQEITAPGGTTTTTTPTGQRRTGGGSGDQGRGNGNANDWLSDEFLNGECFVSGEIGELEDNPAHRAVIFGANTPAADAPANAVRFTSAQAEEFIKLNYQALTLAKPDLQAQDAAKVCFLRFLAVRVGLISPAFDPLSYNVRYNEAVRLTAQETVTKLAAARTNVRDLLAEKTRRDLQKDFSNIVCAVAYMFRVRGHHFIEDMRTKYSDLWKRCQKGSDTAGIPWNLVAHDALHAIIPSILDDYWVAMSKDGKIAGALVKRLDSAPAGTAAIRAVYSGAQDLRMAIPGIYTKFKAHFDELDQIVDTLRANRWAGSINRRFYGPQATAVTFNEQRFGAIAAVIVQCLYAFANSSPLLQSKALLRIADNAPITGGFISTGIAALAKDPNVTRLMLDVPVQAD